jgi:hypothetical protein
MPISPLRILYMDMRYHLHPLQIPDTLPGSPSCSAHAALTVAALEGIGNVDTSGIYPPIYEAFRTCIVTIFKRKSSTIVVEIFEFAGIGNATVPRTSVVNNAEGESSGARSSFGWPG